MALAPCLKVRCRGGVRCHARSIAHRNLSYVLLLGSLVPLSHSFMPTPSLVALREAVNVRTISSHPRRFQLGKLTMCRSNEEGSCLNTDSTTILQQSFSENGLKPVASSPTESAHVKHRLGLASEREAVVLDRRKYIGLAVSTAVALGLPQQAKADESLIWKPVMRPGGGSVFKDITQAEKTYSLEFVEYLSKFLLTYDEPSKKLWKQKKDLCLLFPPGERQQERLEQFASYSASVEYGLRNYNGTDGASDLCRVLARKYGARTPSALLQIAFLFTLMDKYQPSQEIRRVLSRAQNATFTNITVTNRGSGYVGEKTPKVLITTEYEATRPARAEAVLRQTGKVLKVKITDPGSGFTKPPKVVFSGLDSDASEGKKRVQPEAKAVVQDGKVTQVVIRNPGSGVFTPAVGVDAFLSVDFVPRDEDVNVSVPGKGSMVIDQEVDRVEIKNGGNGYTAAYPFKISIQSPQECGGDSNGTKAVLAAKLSPTIQIEKDSSKTNRTQMVSAANLSDTQDLGKIDAVITGLLPTNVGVVFDKEKNRFTFVEKSALGYDIVTDRGPRRPLTKENKLDMSVYARLAVSGAICASIAHGALVPLDTVKIRMQTEPQGKYKGAVDAAVKILTKEGGLKAIVRGLQPEVVGFSIYGAISFAGTEFFKRNVAELAGTKFSLLYPIPIVIVSSVSAAVAASLANCPFMAVKTRLIADEEFAGSSLVLGMKRMIKEEGGEALFAGLVPLVLKEVLFVMSKFAVFEFVRDSIFLFYPDLNDDVGSALFVSLISGTIAGTVSAITSQPGDYLFSKASESAGSSLGGAWKEYLESKRYGDMLTGLQPRLFFGGALIALQFVIYDFCRVQLHVSPNDLNSFLDVMAGVGKT